MVRGRQHLHEIGRLPRWQVTVFSKEFTRGPSCTMMYRVTRLNTTFGLGAFRSRFFVTSTPTDPALLLLLFLLN